MRQVAVAKISAFVFLGFVAVSNGVSAYIGQTTGVLSYLGRTTDGSLYPNLFAFDLFKRTAFALGAGGLLAFAFARVTYGAWRLAKPDRVEEERELRREFKRLTGRHDKLS